MLSSIIVLYPLAHILSLVPKPGSCQILRNRLICVFGVHNSGKITYHMVTWDRMSQIIQNDRGNVMIILMCHNMALRVCRAHNLRKCNILGPISTSLFIPLGHELFFSQKNVRSNTKQNNYKIETIILALFRINLNLLTFFFSKTTR